MSYLPETEAALAELASSESYLFGTHDGTELKHGVVGRAMGDVLFDPAKHQVGDINPLSIWGLVLDEPHVSVVLPDRALHASVVLHTEPGTDRFGAAQAKQWLSRQLHQSIVESMPGMTDRTALYVVGENAAEIAAGTPDMEAIGSDGNPAVNAKLVSELCVDGLAFVVSDFAQLPLDAVPGAEYPATVGLKVNHPLERAFQPGMGVVRLGGRKEVNTDKPRELRRFNDGLESLHSDIVQRLGQVGISVASLITPAQPSDFNVTQADQAIAGAVQQISPY